MAGLYRLSLVRQKRALAYIFGAIIAAAPLQSAKAADQVWGCLLYATNQGQASRIPDQLDGYDERLRSAFGFATLRVLAQGQTEVRAQQQNWLIFSGGIKLSFSDFSRSSDGNCKVTLGLFRGDRQLLETQAKFSPGSPLFIRGPVWREGQLIVAVVILS
ncbi:MAG: hypothetical protein JOY96_10270 [Verrucomicrobia bacterium]|nr:hypothetical protein [Verrucomicrobiota bacterium]MBV9673476.1 hypothetical protein [Verrucomicrobiota bacterium]